MKRVIVSDGSRCTGCGICELVCSAAKEKSYGSFHSLIKITRTGPIMLAVTCRNCEEAPCVTACPQSALEQSEETGTIQVHQEKCNGCTWCLNSCKFGAIHIIKGKAAICDLCQGEPQCVEACPAEALRLTDMNQAQPISKVNSSIGGHKFSKDGLIVGPAEDFERRWLDLIDTTSTHARALKSSSQRIVKDRSVDHVGSDKHSAVSYGKNGSSERA